MILKRKDKPMAVAVDSGQAVTYDTVINLPDIEALNDAYDY